MRNYYWSDPHFDHLAIISICQRPFASVAEMNEEMETQLERILHPERYFIDRAPGKVFHLGDIAFGLRRYVEGGSSRLLSQIMDVPSQNVLITGNHDGVQSSSASVYRLLFGEIHGTDMSYESNTLIVEDEAFGRPYKLLLSHVPQRDLQGCDYNLYGHLHNLFVRNPDALYEEDNDFLAQYTIPKHINVSVEIIGYRPRTLEELLTMQQKLSLRML